MIWICFSGTGTKTLYSLWVSHEVLWEFVTWMCSHASNSWTRPAAAGAKGGPSTPKFASWPANQNFSFFCSNFWVGGQKTSHFLSHPQAVYFSLLLSVTLWIMLLSALLMLQATRRYQTSFVICASCAAFVLHLMKAHSLKLHLLSLQFDMLQDVLPRSNPSAASTTSTTDWMKKRRL